MAYPFRTIIIIYNPNSTGESYKNARRLRRKLEAVVPARVRVSLRATKHAGHAESIAADYAAKDPKLLLVSSSGDGGYHEVVNGALAHPTRHMAVAVMPSGNANDHYHATAERELVERIKTGKTRAIDVLEVRARRHGRPWQRYAHSYIGFGLTASIGKRLTAASLNPVNEKWLVLKYLLRFRYVCLKLNGGRSWRRYSSVIVANIDRMSKIIQLSTHAVIDDGQFELYTTPWRSTIKTIVALLRGAMLGLVPVRRTTTMTLRAKRRVNLQCDGEVFRIDGRSDITVRACRRRLKTLA